MVEFLSGCILGALWVYVLRAYIFDADKKKMRLLRESLKRCRELLTYKEIRLEHERNVRKGCVIMPRENYRALLRSGKPEL